LRASPRALVRRPVSGALCRAAERRLPPGARRGGRRRRHALDPPAGRVRHRRRPRAHQGGGRRGARRRRPRSGARRQFHGARLGLLRRRAARRAAPVVVRLEEAGGRAAPRAARHARLSAQLPRPRFPRAGLSPRPGDGDSLGSRVEGKAGAEIALLYPDGVRELADGGPYHLLAGQPTDDSEMALILARSILRERKYDRDRVLDAYRDWLTTRPVDVGRTTEQGLLGLLTPGSESH